MRDDRHPDANQLAACIEGRLEPRAARALRRHLSRCAACREWAGCTGALCLRSGLAEVPTAAHRTGLAIWMGAPLALAASAVVAVVVLWHAPVIVQAPPAKAPLPASPVAAVASRAVPVPVPVIPAPRTAVAERRVRRSLPAQPRATGPVVVPAGGTPALPAPQPAEEVAVAPALDFTPLATGFADQPAQRGAQAELAAWGGATPFQPIRSEPVNTVLLAPSSAAPTRGGLAPASGMVLGWAISRGGQVLRSIGSGLWATVPLVPGVRFRALASAGRAIWAGGRSDQVYVSPDQGAHWTQVMLPDVGAAPKDLASISASDEAHVVIADGAGQEWRTSDGGASWVVTRK